MHVGVFSYYYLPVVNGVTITIADWKRVGQQAGTKFTIFIPNSGDNQETKQDVISYPAVPLYKRFGITVPMFPESFISKNFLSGNIDVLHVHHPFNIGKLALSISEKYYIPLVFTYHTRYTDYFKSYLPWISGKVIIGFVSRSLVGFMNRCNAITVANETLKKELIKSGVRTPVHIVPPGIDTQKFSTGNRRAARERLGISPDDTVLLYVGRLAREKNIYLIMKSFVKIHDVRPDVKLLLAGSGLEEYRLKSFVRKHGLGNTVIFATEETTQSIAGIYNTADMFLYASQTETFGRVIVEAMAAGLAVVALAGPSIIDVLKDNITGCIVYEKSPRALAARAIDLLSNPDRRNAIGTMAQKEAKEKYDTTVSWKKLYSVYEAVTHA